MNLVSVVTPVFNTDPKYLVACLDSVLNQTYTNIEIILVDDKSENPQTLKVLEDYQSQHSCIKVIHNEINGGLSFARNAGVAQASGKYLTFLDSDDLFTPCCIERMVQALEQNHTELVLCQTQNFTLDPDVQTNCDALKMFLDESAYIDMNQFVQAKQLFNINTCAYGKMMLLDVYRERNMDFNPELRLWEDNEWAYRILPRFKNFSFLNFVGIKRLVYARSLSKTSGSKSILALLQVFELLYKSLKQDNLIKLYADRVLLFVVAGFVNLEESTPKDDLLGLSIALKNLLNRCEYHLNIQYSRFEEDPSTHDCCLIFQHASNLNNGIIVRGKFSNTYFLKALINP